MALPDADREILLNVLQSNERKVWLHDSNWREQVEDGCKHCGSVLLLALPEARQDLKLAILKLVAEPMEIGFLLVYPVVEGVQRYSQGFAVRLP